MTDNIITPELVALDANFGGTTTEVITNLATLVQGAGRATSTDVLAGDALAREAKSDTGVPGGVAIPHCRSEAVTQPTLAHQLQQLRQPLSPRRRKAAHQATM